jgi:DNA-binding SARP family transcriptional activator
VDVRILGPIEVIGRDGAVDIRGTRLRALLVILAVQAGRVVPAERLVFALYGDDAPRRALNALQQVVSKLRVALAGAHDRDLLVTRPPGYLLDVTPADVDALRFEQIIAEARQVRPGDPARASQLLGAALALWRGEAFSDIALDELAPVRARTSRSCTTRRWRTASTPSSRSATTGRPSGRSRP